MLLHDVKELERERVDTLELICWPLGLAELTVESGEAFR